MTTRFAHADRGQYVNTCPRCKTAPATQKAGCLCDPCYADVVQRALVAIRAAVIATLQPPERDICEACGCLVLPDEHCPGCMAIRQILHETKEIPAA